MSDKNFLDEQCLLTFSVFGSCRQQECLTPDMMSIPFSAENVEVIISADGESAVTLPGLPVHLPITVADVRKVPNSFSTEIKIMNVEPSLFQENFYTFEIMYIFTMKVQLYDAANNLIPVELDTQPDPTFQNFLTIGMSYVFHGNLCGGTAQDIVASTNFLAPQITYSQATPYVRVSAIANILQIDIEEVCHEELCASVPQQIQLFNDTYDPYDYPFKIIRPFVGLFAIYELIRPVDVLVPGELVTTNSITESGLSAEEDEAARENGCYPPVCTKVDPCTYFNNLPFPFTDFDPDDCTD